MSDSPEFRVSSMGASGWRVRSTCSRSTSTALKTLRLDVDVLEDVAVDSLKVLCVEFILERMASQLGNATGRRDAFDLIQFFRVTIPQVPKNVRSRVNVRVHIWRRE